ncbi:hypothetical protein I4641_05585 [Waterburya agarophytonicola K14]|uniref:O-antigen polymerase n=1 Tax=Waterburya agarophytonicola KI4 TaxID=2874699 RepID=A0A964BN01_9CYAN|nr:hypothetical protein [Waterburya agarophytonicola]MCC0176449.1 hypothetical protein [Waterburya agarophytonicola KI4]
MNTIYEFLIKNVFKIVVIITIYFPLEDFFLKFIPAPEVVITVLRLIPEFFLYGLLACVVAHKISTGKPLRKTPIDIAIVAFFLAASVSIAINQADLFESIANLRTNFRYLSVYYILVNIDISSRQVSNILKIIVLMGLIQAVISSVQFFLPDTIDKLLFARIGTKAALGEFKANASFGTLFDPTNLSSFLLVTDTIFLSNIYLNDQKNSLIPNWKNLAIMLTFLFGIFATKKRAALLIALLIHLIVLSRARGTRKVGKFIWVSLISLLLFSVISAYFLDWNIAQELGLLPYFTEIFTEEYWNHTSSSSRGFLIYKICTALVSSFSLFGFGPTADAVEQGIKSSLALSSTNLDQINWTFYVLDDPYWFAILGYFGIVGLLFYWLVFFRFYQSSKFLTNAVDFISYKSLGLAFSNITILFFLYAFVERILRLRACSFYFWTIAGLTINSIYMYQQNQKYMSWQSNKKEDPI